VSHEGDAKRPSALGATTGGREGELIAGCRLRQVICRRRRFLTELAAGGEIRDATVVMEQAKGSGGTQATGRNMIEETGHELLDRESEEHLVMFVRMFVGDT
jgi:hypothetical protein